MTRTAILAGTVLLALAGSAHARQWFRYNFESHRCETSSGDPASPAAWHEYLHKQGINDTIEIVRDPKTSEVIAATIMAELPHNRSPSSWIWFTSTKLCARSTIRLSLRIDELK